jgi:hypothetical protein
MKMPTEAVYKARNGEHRRLAELETIDCQKKIPMNHLTR